MRMDANDADTRIIERERSYLLNGLLFRVHNELGRFCVELQYADALEQLLGQNAIRYEREKILPISFEGERPGRNRVDFLVDDRIVVELKAKTLLERQDFTQVLRYLEAMRCRLGILVNFREKALKPRRVLNARV